jgi:L-2-hydroxyglutarate oxidase LhgO
LTDVDCIVIGAGVIGLAIARASARDGRSVMILERERQFGMHTSSRNSEVIHAGIHYEPGSLKARLCVAGRELLYRYCVRRGIDHRRCGKFTVATSQAQVASLERIAANARANDVLDLELLDGDHARRVEPELHCVAALSSPSTGIIDSHAYMQALLADAEGCGADISYGTRVRAMRPTAAGIEVFVESQTGSAISARFVINAAGLDAHRVAAMIEGFPADHIPSIHYAKGSYFGLQGRAPFRRLIYPVGEFGWLGVHMTIDLAGAARFGPDIEWIKEVDYAVDSQRAEAFYDAIKRYWPRIQPGQLTPGYAGVRPKLTGPGETSRDFCVSGPHDHGVAGVVNLFGIESPGLTASLALGDVVAAMLID